MKKKKKKKKTHNVAVTDHVQFIPNPSRFKKKSQIVTMQ